eukprot:Sspe_Gene.109381::Locus_89514_Transcript_1_1_Confidence_1.000_Length_892::g.109381::m.109381
MLRAPFSPTRALLFKRTNPWLAGKPTTVLLFQHTPTRLGAFRATKVKHDLVFSPLVGGFLPFVHVIQNTVNLFLGGSYMILPWVAIFSLAIYLEFYYDRVHDYDKGHVAMGNYIPVNDPNPAVTARLVFDNAAWAGWIENWVKKSSDVDGKNWVVNPDDGSIEPGTSKVSPGGLAAYHALNSMSLKWELVKNNADWNDGWVKAGHQIMLIPSWMWSGNQHIHARKRTYVGDWVEEHYPWTRSPLLLAPIISPVEY